MEADPSLPCDGGFAEVPVKPVERVVPMSTAMSPFFRDTAFDPFLFAAIGEAPNGMLLSVQSAIARLDLDPWREAASLSSMPPPAATERLTWLLSSLPSSQLKTPATATVARLVGLLPRAARVPSWTPAAASLSKAKVSWPAALCVILVLVVIGVAQFIERRAPDTTTPAGGWPSTSAHDSDRSRPAD